MAIPNPESEDIEDSPSATTVLKRKSNSNHDLRPNPKLSDLFTSPASGAPVIIQLASEPRSFCPMSLTEKKKFMACLIDIIGQVKPGTKWTQRGELYIYPTTKTQKNLLLQQTYVNKCEIKVSLCKSELEVKGVIYNIPPNNTEEELRELLTNQGVIGVKRFSTPGPNNTLKILPMVTLHFNSRTLPREVCIAHEIFPVKKYIPRPSLCRKCWIFGHPENVCASPIVCRMCSNNHEESAVCPSPRKGPTCSKCDHIAGTAACPIFSHRQSIIRYAYEHNVSVTEAGRILASRPYLHPKLPEKQQPHLEQTSMKQEIDDLKAKMEEMQYAINNPKIPDATERRIQAVEKEIGNMKIRLEPLLTLETSMATGFTSLDNRLTALSDMILKDREDRTARQQAKDRIAAAAAQPTKGRSKTEPQKKIPKT